MTARVVALECPHCRAVCSSELTDGTQPNYFRLSRPDEELVFWCEGHRCPGFGGRYSVPNAPVVTLKPGRPWTEADLVGTGILEAVAAIARE